MLIDLCQNLIHCHPERFKFYGLVRHNHLNFLFLEEIDKPLNKHNQAAMENNQFEGFLPVWHWAMTLGIYLSLGIAILIYVVYKIRVSSKKDYKEKYDFIRQNEIKYYSYVFYIIGFGAFCLINTYGQGNLEFDFIWFFVRLFIAISGGTLVAYIAHLVLQYYHPSSLSKKLKKWRYMPRTSSAGNKMRLLSEEEEDVHLDEGMMAEEEVFSIDYDVWIDDKSGETKIEKYPGHLEALQCNNCGFYTMRVKREEILKKPTDTEAGELVKHYECGYCGSVRATQFRIAPNDDNVMEKQPEKAMAKTGWTVIRVEIVDSEGNKKNYEFQTIEQAQNFLKASKSQEATVN